jgi:hypothetical protein
MIGRVLRGIAASIVQQTRFKRFAGALFLQGHAVNEPIQLLFKLGGFVPVMDHDGLGHDEKLGLVWKRSPVERHGPSEAPQEMLFVGVAFHGSRLNQGHCFSPYLHSLLFEASAQLAQKKTPGDQPGRGAMNDAYIAPALFRADQTQSGRRQLTAPFNE